MRQMRQRASRKSLYNDVIFDYTKREALCRTGNHVPKEKTLKGSEQYYEITLNLYRNSSISNEKIFTAIVAPLAEN